MRFLGRWVVIFGGALAAFGVFLAMKGAQPLEVYGDMFQSMFGSNTRISEVLVKWTPILLTGLAVAVPARAGLFNIGGEGQLVLGAIGAAGVAQALDGQLTAAPTLALMALGGALLGAAWALVAAILKLATRVSEAISTLLLNYVAILLLEYLVNGPWKDPASLGFPEGEAVGEAARFGVIFSDTRLHVGVLLAAMVAVIVWFVLRGTVWGFRLRVAGGNPEAARRAGMRVGLLVVSAMVVGGLLAGLAGMIQVGGVEGRVRPGMSAGVGFIGFLASWMAAHKPGHVALAGLLLAAIAVGGDSLQIDAGLPSATVNVLMALVLLAVLSRSTSTGSATTDTVPIGTSSDGTPPETAKAGP